MGDGAGSGGGQAREMPVGGRRELVAGWWWSRGWVGGGGEGVARKFSLRSDGVFVSGKILLTIRRH